MQLSVIRRGDTLNPMVVNVNINMADVKGIKTQFHLRRTKILIKLKDRAILCVKSGEFIFGGGHCTSYENSVMSQPGNTSWQSTVTALYILR